MSYDAVVIGAGINGLAAAHHLATRGWRTIVVEARDQPGGAVKTAEVTLPGFRHDLCAMNLSMFAGSPYFAAHREELQAHGLGLGCRRRTASLPRSATSAAISASAPTPKTTPPRLPRLSPEDTRGLACDGAEEFGRDAADLRPARRADAVLVEREGGVEGVAFGRHRRALRARQAAAGVAARLSRRPLRRSQGQGDAGGLGSPSRLSAGHAGRRIVSLCRGNGQPELRHGHRCGRRRQRHQRDDLGPARPGAASC